MKIICIIFSLLITQTAIAEEQKHDQLISILQKEITKNYVMEEKIPDIINSLSKLKLPTETHGPENTVANTVKIAEILSSALQQHDKHFAVRWNDPKSTDKNVVYEDWFSKLDRKNSGFQRVEILDGNIGYIDFFGFDNVNVRSKLRAQTAMQFVEGTDALIFDLRNNGGGSADMVRLISSYLLKGRVHLNSIYWKETDSTTEFWTYSDIESGTQYDTPVYLLTSKDTFSAAEEFAYNLQALKRATIIGEKTKGGANPWRFFDVADGYRLAIPIAKAINPITNTNWEGTGVKPNIEASKDAAFNIAYQLALQNLQKNKIPNEQLKEIEGALQTFN